MSLDYVEHHTINTGSRLFSDRLQVHIWIGKQKQLHADVRENLCQWVRGDRAVRMIIKKIRTVNNYVGTGRSFSHQDHPRWCTTTRFALYSQACCIPIDSPGSHSLHSSTVIFCYSHVSDNTQTDDLNHAMAVGCNAIHTSNPRKMRIWFPKNM